MANKKERTPMPWSIHRDYLGVTLRNGQRVVATFGREADAELVLAAIKATKAAHMFMADRAHLSNGHDFAEVFRSVGSAMGDIARAEGK